MSQISSLCISLDNCELGSLEILENNCVVELDHFTLEVKDGQKTSIQLSNAVLVTKNSKFSGLHSIDSMIYSVHGVIQITNSVFVKNEMKSIIDALYGEISIINSTFSRNIGTLLTITSVDKVTIKYTKIKNTLALTSSAIFGSYIKEFGMVDSYFEGNKGMTGAVLNLSDHVRFSSRHNVFEGNAASCSGGALSLGLPSFNIFYNTTFSRNIANESGGCILYRLQSRHYSRPKYMSVWETRLTSVSFLNNSAGYSGGAIAYTSIQREDIEMIEMQKLFSFQTEKNSKRIQMTFDRFQNDSDHISLWLNNLHEGCTWYGNRALFGGSIVSWVPMQLKFVTCIFSNNLADGKITPYGGAIYARSSALWVSNSEFILNNALQGGAIFIESSSALFVNVSFKSNIARMGGALGLLTCEIAVVECRFYNNIAYSEGSVISLEAFSNSMIEFSKLSDMTGTNISMFFGEDSIQRISHSSLVFNLSTHPGNLDSLISDSHSLSLQTYMVTISYGFMSCETGFSQGSLSEETKVHRRTGGLYNFDTAKTSCMMVGIIYPETPYASGKTC